MCQVLSEGLPCLSVAFSQAQLTHLFFFFPTPPQSPVRSNIFDNLSLTVPFRGGVSLESCLFEYVRAEKIEGFVCARCSILAAIASLEKIPGSRAEKAARLAELQDLLKTSDAEDLLVRASLVTVVSTLS